MESIHQTLDRDQCQEILNVVINLWVRPNARKFLSSSVSIGFSRHNQFHGVKSSSCKNTRIRNKAMYCTGRKFKNLELPLKFITIFLQ
jgi:hypothetical protein